MEIIEEYTDEKSRQAAIKKHPKMRLKLDTITGVNKLLFFTSEPYTEIETFQQEVLRRLNTLEQKRL